MSPVKKTAGWSTPAKRWGTAGDLVGPVAFQLPQFRLIGDFLPGGPQWPQRDPEAHWPLDLGIVNPMPMRTMNKRHEICFQLISCTEYFHLARRFPVNCWRHFPDRHITGLGSGLDLTGSPDLTEVTFQLLRAGDCHWELVAGAAMFGAPSWSCPSDSSCTSAMVSKLGPKRVETPVVSWL